MSWLFNAGKVFLAVGFMVALPADGKSQSAFFPQGGEFNISPRQPGDQVWPKVDLRANGGFAVWQDNNSDGEGWGISAQRLNQNFSPTLSPFRINAIAQGDQEKPQVTLLPNGGAVFVWQGGQVGFQDVYARFLAADGTFITGDIQVNSYTREFQITPAVAASSDGTVLVVWGSYGQEEAPQGHQGVYGQRFSSTGEKLGTEFLINQTTTFNQRTPSVAALNNGTFAVIWVTERDLGIRKNTRDSSGRVSDAGAGAPVFAVQIMGRIYDRNGTALTDEFALSSGQRVAANPVVRSLGPQGFSAVWGERDHLNRSNGWDIYNRTYSQNQPQTEVVRVNSEIYGDQYAPQLAVIGNDVLVIWTSLGQDESWEGVYGQFITGEGRKIGPELRLNTTTVSQQMHPAVASDLDKRLLVVWSSFGAVTSFDLYGQRLGADQTLPPPPAPYVSALSQSRLSITWPELSGYEGVSYEIYVDDNPSPQVVTKSMWTATQLLPASSHTFRLAYRLSNGSRSPLSEPAAAKTWGEDENGDGLPDDWQAQFWQQSAWPPAHQDTDQDGADNLKEFLAGTDPLDTRSVLRTEIIRTSQGYRLFWNTQPGLVYQVQTSTDAVSWLNSGSARFAPGLDDSISVPADHPVFLYRLIRLR